MVRMPKKPVSWGEDFNDVQSEPNIQAPRTGLQEDGTFAPTPGGILDGLPKERGGSTFEWLFGPVDSGEARDRPGAQLGSDARAEGGPPSPAAGLGDIAGKVWNLPNTAIGLGYGSLGYLVGWPSHWLGLQKDPPGVSLGNNAVQFT